MKHVLYALGVLLLGAVLAGCSSGFRHDSLDAQASFITSKTWVSSNLKFSSPQDNCVSAELYSREQGRGKPFSGGLSYNPFAATTTSYAIGTGLKTSFFASFSPTANTEILIIDDFGANQYTLPPFQNYSTVSSLLASGLYTHGALVMYHTNEVIKGSGLYSGAPQTINGQTTYTKNGQTLKVTPVNTQLASRAAIFNGVSVNVIKTTTLVEVLNEKGKDYLLGSKVFNMSFGLVPCEIYADFELSGLKTFSEYIEKFVIKNYGNAGTDTNGKVNTPTEKVALTGIIESTNLATEPLKALIAAQSSRHIFVAAAGNYGVDASMYPANWSGVVNVTGSSADNRNSRLSSEFNRGEVMTVGSLFEIKPPNGSAGKTIYYYGTSFATPSVSAFSALDLAGQGRCTDSQTFKSELALDPPSLTDRRLETSTGAVQIRCGSY